MNKMRKVHIYKLLILISAVMLMMLLCGCRTRVTNNTEVTNVLEDDGFMQESYQIRRDELGIPVAETPIFTGWESEEEDVYGDEEYYDEFEDLEEEDYEEEDVEEITEPPDPASTSTRPGNGPQVRPVVRPPEPAVVQIKVTLDVNAKNAKCDQAYVMVKKGATYGALPVPTREGYDFKGWYTAEKDGDKVSAKTKLKSDKDHTLYAHWKKTEKKTYKVTFDGNGGNDEVTLSSTEMSVKEDGKYGDMPSAKRKKYTFIGWFTEAEGGSQVTGGSKFTANADQTLYAQWEYDPYTWWDGEFKTASNVIDDASKAQCIIDEGDEAEENFVKDCKGVSTPDTAPGYIIKFVKNYEDYDEETLARTGEEVYVKHKDSASGAKVILISDKAIKGSKEQQLLYKMMLFNAIYGSPENTEEADKINQAAGDLVDANTVVNLPYIYSGADYVEPTAVPEGKTTGEPTADPAAEQP